MPTAGKAQLASEGVLNVAQRWNWRSVGERSLEARQIKLFDEYIRLQLNPKQLERIVENIRATRDRLKDYESKLAEYEEFVGLSYDDILGHVKKLKASPRKRSVKGDQRVRVRLRKSS